MLAKRVIDTLTKMIDKNGVDIGTLTYKNRPIVAQFGNAAFEMDVLLTMQWIAYNYRESIADALLIRHPVGLFISENQDLNELQIETYQHHSETNRLTAASERKVDIYIVLALRILCFNGDSVVMTPVDYRSRLEDLAHGVVVLNYAALAYSNIKNPNRKALSHEITKEMAALEAHQIEASIEHDNSPTI